jgi:hypothetical protein
MAMLFQVTLLALLGMGKWTGVCACLSAHCNLVLYAVCVCSSKLSVEEYLRQHPELTPHAKVLTDELQQQTLWDRSSIAGRDLLYPIENHPVPDVKMQLSGQRKRLRTRERRQIDPGGPLFYFSYYYLSIFFYSNNITSMANYISLLKATHTCSYQGNSNGFSMGL